MFDSSFLAMPSALNLTPPTPSSSKSLAATIPPPPLPPPPHASALASPMPMPSAADLYAPEPESGDRIGECGAGGHKFPRCFGCAHDILDRYLLTLPPDQQQWHCGCLRCVECGCALDETARVCFVRAGRTFCKSDYTRLFLRSCGKCGQELQADERVMRTRTRFFHTACFCCAVCKRPLNPGDRIAVRPSLTSNALASCAPTARWPADDETLLCEAHATADAAAALCVSTTAAAAQQQLAPAPLGQPLTLAESLPPAIAIAPSAAVTLSAADYQPCLLSAASQRPSSLCDDDQLIADTDDKDDLPEGLEDETSSNANDEKEARVYTGLTVSTRRMSSGGDGDGESSGLSSPGSGSDHSPSSRHSSAGGTGGGLATPNSHTTGGGLSGSGNGAGHGDRPSKRGRDGQKTTRVRTVLNEKQLQTLRTCYAANPRPDALMKEQLVEMTGLSPRVIRVWFQNKRCKDKKKSIILKQLQQQQEKNGLLGKSFAGVPLVAPSPVVQAELAMPVEIQAFHAAAAAAAAAAGMGPYARATGTLHHTPVSSGIGIGGVQVPLWKSHAGDAGSGLSIGMGNPGGVPPLLAPDVAAAAYGASPVGYQLSAYDEFVAAHNAALSDVLYAR